MLTKAMCVLCVCSVFFAFPSMAEEEECAIDLVMQDQLTKTNNYSKNAIEATVKDRDIESEACIPALAALNGGLNINTASLSSLFGGLGTKIRDMACDAANDAVKGVASALGATWEAPYGLASIGGGLTTDGSSGVNRTETDTTSNYINRQILGEAGQSINGLSRGLDAEVSDLTGIKNNRLNNNTNAQETNFSGGSNALDNF